MQIYLFLAYGFTISIMMILSTHIIWDYSKASKNAQKRKK